MEIRRSLVAAAPHGVISRSFTVCENKPLPLQLCALEIQDYSDRSVSDPQIIEHLPALVIGDAIDHFDIHDDPSMHDQIGHVFADFHGLVDHVEALLLQSRNLPDAKLHHEGIFIRLLVQSMPQSV